MEPVLPNASWEVPSEDVEKMLKKVWSEAAQIDERTDSDGEKSPRLKTTLANFVMVQTSPSRGKLDEVISDLCIQFPSRFFIISFDSTIPVGTLSTGVSSRCVLAQSGQHVCSEEVLIRCGDSSSGNVGSLLRSLFVPDVPIIALVFGDPFQPSESALGDLLPQLREMCDLFLYDSRMFDDYVRGAELLLSLRRVGDGGAHPSMGRGRGNFGVGVRDLSWYLTQRYRGLLAERFDSGAYHDLIPSISKLSFTSAKGAQDPRALLLAGWIAAVLNWRAFSKSGALVVGVTDSGKKVALEFLQGEPGSNFKFSIVADGAVFSVQYNDAGSFYETSSKLKELEKDRTLTVPKFTLADLILAPVQSSGLDDFFTRSLERSIEIAGALQ